MADPPGPNARYEGVEGVAESCFGPRQPWASGLGQRNLKTHCKLRIANLTKGTIEGRTDSCRCFSRGCKECDPQHLTWNLSSNARWSDWQFATTSCNSERGGYIISVKAVLQMQL
jgi:hypothetical protein